MLAYQNARITKWLLTCRSSFAAWRLSGFTFCALFHHQVVSSKSLSFLILFFFASSTIWCGLPYAGIRHMSQTSNSVVAIFRFFFSSFELYLHFLSTVAIFLLAFLQRWEVSSESLQNAKLILQGNCFILQQDSLESHGLNRLYSSIPLSCWRLGRKEAVFLNRCLDSFCPTCSVSLNVHRVVFGESMHGA